VLYLVLVALHEVILLDLTSIYTASINLPGLVVLMVAMYKSETVALWFGFFVGLVIAARAPEAAGWYALLTAAVGVAAFHARERLNLDSLWSRLLLILCGVLLHNILILLIGRPDGFMYVLVTGSLPGAVYTAIAGWVFFLFKEGRVTFEKVKSVF